MVKIRLGLNPVLTPLFLLIAAGSSLLATEKIREQEEIECQVCHSETEQSAETLTDQGLYYQYMNTLAGYEQVLHHFDSCTFCHVDQAGAAALTGQGHRFQWMMDDMVGLRAWLDEFHPRPEEETGAKPSGE